MAKAEVPRRDLSGQVAIITGGAQGLGRAFSIALLDRGGKVMIGDRSRETGEATCRELQQRYGKSNCAFFQVDVTNHDRLDALYQATVKTFSCVDIVCNNAGVGFEVHNSAEGMWRKTIEINLTALIDSTYLAQHYMDRDNGGRGGIVINISSMSGVLAMPFSATYAASKHGVIGFVRSMEVWPAQHDIHVYALMPAFTETDMLKTGLENDLFAEAVKMGGILQPEQVAEGFIRLLDEQPESGSCMRVTVQKGIDYQKFYVPKIRANL